VRSHINWIEEHNIPYTGVETSPLREPQKGQYLLATGCYEQKVRNNDGWERGRMRHVMENES